MGKKNQTISLVMALGAVVVLAAGALVYYQQSAGAFRIPGGTAACPLKQMYGVSNPTYGNTTCLNLGSIAFAQPFTINSVNSTGQFKEMVLNLSGAGDGQMDVELRSYDPTKKPTEGQVLATTAASTLHIEMRDNNKKLAIVASPILSLANGKYVLTMAPKPYSTIPVNLARVSGDNLTGWLYFSGWQNMQGQYGNLMLSNTLSTPNATALDPFADNRFKVATLSNGKKQRAALMFTTGAAAKLNKVKILIDSAMPTPNRIQARLMELTAAQVAANNPDAGRQLSQATQTVTNRDSTSITLTIDSPMMKANTTYALVLDNDKINNAATEAWLKADTSAASGDYQSSQAVVYASTDGRTVSWLKEPTRYFSFIPTFVTNNGSPLPSPTPTVSPSPTPTPSPTHTP